MGFAGWVKNLLIGKGAPGEEETKGLNFQTVIGQHLQWRQRLAAVIEGRSREKLSPVQVGASHECTLGKWLNGPIKHEHANSPEFQELIREHNRFHECAAQILQHAQSGQKQAAQDLLTKGEFPALSRSVCARLGRLYQGITGNEMAVDEEDENPAEDEVGGLNFRAVVDAHMAWRRRLGDVITGKSNEQLTLAQVSSSADCTLGQWLKEKEKDARFAQDANFQTLVSEHAMFHKTAGEVLTLAQSGKKEEARQVLDGREFVGLSRTLCNRLLDLYKVLSKR